MSIEDGTTEFKLSRELEYRFNGQAEFAQTVLLREPCMDHAKHCLKLKQMITRGLIDAEKIFNKGARDEIAMAVEQKPFHENTQELEKDTELAIEMMTMAIQASTAVDVGEFMETFKTMACMKARKPIALLDGRQTMTQALWANLKVDDGFKMAIWWCSFFAMPSVGGEPITLGPQPVSPTVRMEV